MSGQEYYDPETGELLGWVHETPDGGAVLIDEDGVILEAETPDGNPADPSYYDGVEIADDADDDPGYEQQPQFDPRLEARDHIQRLSEEAASARFVREAEVVERELGRKFSDRELHSILTNYRDDIDAGLEPNIYAAAANVNIPTGGDHASRVARAMDSLQDAERRETGESFDPDQREWHEPASSSPSDIRVARAMNFVDHGISSAEQAEQDSYLYDEEDEE